MIIKFVQQQKKIAVLKKRSTCNSLQNQITNLKKNKITKSIIYNDVFRLQNYIQF
jgi:hypothetical protein